MTSHGDGQSFPGGIDASRASLEVGLALSCILSTTGVADDGKPRFDDESIPSGWMINTWEILRHIEIDQRSHVVKGRIVARPKTSVR